jgi:hypothetical protein
MVKIEDRLFIGSENDCRNGTEQLAVVHACKSPCHQRAVGYRGSLLNSHPNYLFLQQDNDLYLNIIDPPVPLFKIETFKRFLAFARSKYDCGSSLLIHCNQGESRARQVLPFSLWQSTLASYRIHPMQRPREHLNISSQRINRASVSNGFLQTIGLPFSRMIECQHAA